MPRAQLTVDQLELMRNRLSDAAMKIYRRDGLKGISFRRLAEAEGMSHTLPYRYFANKEALLARMRLNALGRFETTIKSSESKAQGELERVYAIAQGYMSFARQYPDDYLLIFATHQPAARLYPELLKARRSVFDHAVSALQRCLDKGLLIGDARDLAHVLWVSMHGLMSLHAAGQLVHGRELDQIADLLVARLLGNWAPVPVEPLSSGQAKRKATK